MGPHRRSRLHDRPITTAIHPQCSIHSRQAKLLRRVMPGVCRGGAGFPTRDQLCTRQRDRMATRDDTIPERLPALTLSGPDGALPLRAPELGSRVILLVRDDDLARARPYITQLEQHVGEVRNWYADALIVTEQATPDTELPSARAEPDAWTALGIPAGENALIIEIGRASCRE